MSEEKLSLGEYFRSEREKRGLELKAIEERTKIPAQTLIFLEENQVDMLPPRTFLRGFLRVISREFNFDEEELLAHLEETLASHETMNKQVKAPSYRARPVMPMIVLVAAAALVVIVLFVFSLRQCSRDPLEDEKTGAWIPAPVYACIETGDRVFS